MIFCSPPNPSAITVTVVTLLTSLPQNTQPCAWGASVDVYKMGFYSCNVLHNFSIFLFSSMIKLKDCVWQIQWNLLVWNVFKQVSFIGFVKHNLLILCSYEQSWLIYSKISSMMLLSLPVKGWILFVIGVHKEGTLVYWISFFSVWLSSL